MIGGVDYFCEEEKICICGVEMMFIFVKRR